MWPKPKVFSILRGSLSNTFISNQLSRDQSVIALDFNKSFHHLTLQQIQMRLYQDIFWYILLSRDVMILLTVGSGLPGNGWNEDVSFLPVFVLKRTLRSTLLYPTADCTLTFSRVWARKWSSQALLGRWRWKVECCAEFINTSAGLKMTGKEGVRGEIESGCDPRQSVQTDWLTV